MNRNYSQIDLMFTLNDEGLFTCISKPFEGVILADFCARYHISIPDYCTFARFNFGGDASIFIRQINVYNIKVTLFNYTLK